MRGVRTIHSLSGLLRGQDPGSLTSHFLCEDWCKINDEGHFRKTRSFSWMIYKMTVTKHMR